jgi:BirA family biotin operon repressor/biotin-[acetyl-CoA-carboxylase] ligase
MSINTKTGQVIEPAASLQTGEFLSRLSKYGKIYLYDSISSTQEIARKIARTQFVQEESQSVLAHISAIIIASSQTHGLGRLGRNWYSSEHGLHCSIIIAYPKSDDFINIWTMLTAKIIIDLLQSTFSIPVYIKWPNDLVCDADSAGRFKKIGGILCETQSSIYQPKTRHLILGIGLNVNHTSFPVELPDATSLKQQLIISKNYNQDINRNEILINIIDKISQELTNYQNALQNNIINEMKTGLIKDIKKKSIVIGKKIRVERRFRSITGTAIDIDEQGHLVIRTEADRIVIIDSGQVIKITGQ